MTRKRDDDRPAARGHDVDDLVRAALLDDGSAARNAAVSRVLRKINGRSPRTLADAASALVARRVAFASALVLCALWCVEPKRSRDDSLVGVADSSAFAWIIPDETEVETRAPVETLVAELFATEVPE